MAVRIADVMSLVSDLVDFCRSAHEALAERRRTRETRDAEARARKAAEAQEAPDARPKLDA